MSKTDLHKTPPGGGVDRIFVVSTDIKKSSALWAFNNGEWMKTHLYLHHAIIQLWADDFGFTILPNSPEGDAFIMYKRGHAVRNVLKEVRGLQERFECFRQGGMLTIPKTMKGYKAMVKGGIFNANDGAVLRPGIHIRVGVSSAPAPCLSEACSDNDWREYNYTGTNNKTSVSYQGDLVKWSENMDVRAPVDGISYIQKDKGQDWPKGPWKTSWEATVSDLRPTYPPFYTQIWRPGRPGAPTYVLPTAMKYASNSTHLINYQYTAAVLFINGGVESQQQHSSDNYKEYKIKIKRDDTRMVLLLAKQNSLFGVTQAVKKKQGVSTEVPEPPNTVDAMKHAKHYITNVLMKETGKKMKIGLSVGLVNIVLLPFTTPTRTTYVMDVFGDTVNLAARAEGLSAGTQKVAPPRPQEKETKKAAKERKALSKTSKAFLTVIVEPVVGMQTFINDEFEWSVDTPENPLKKKTYIKNSINGGFSAKLTRDRINAGPATKEVLMLQYNKL